MRPEIEELLAAYEANSFVLANPELNQLVDTTLRTRNLADRQMRILETLLETVDTREEGLEALGRIKEIRAFEQIERERQEQEQRALSREIARRLGK